MSKHMYTKYEIGLTMKNFDDKFKPIIKSNYTHEYWSVEIYERLIPVNPRDTYLRVRIFFEPDDVPVTDSTLYYIERVEVVVLKVSGGETDFRIGSGGEIHRFVEKFMSEVKQ